MRGQRLSERLASPGQRENKSRTWAVLLKLVGLVLPPEGGVLPRPCPVWLPSKPIDFFFYNWIREFLGGRKRVGWASGLCWRPRSGLCLLRGCHRRSVAQLPCFQVTTSKRRPRELFRKTGGSPRCEEGAGWPVRLLSEDAGWSPSGSQPVQGGTVLRDETALQGASRA